MATIVYLALVIPLWFFVAQGRSVAPGTNQETLQLVHVLFRHGDRTPDKLNIYPNDPHLNYTYLPLGNGQLTNAGKKKEYSLGKALHKRYGKFLGLYNIDSTDARCTDYNRTKMSLQLVLASLFPPENELIWEKRLKWQPVPFNYWTLKDDHILGDPFKNCPTFKKLYLQLLESDEGRKLLEKYENIIGYMTNHTGHELTPKRLSDLYFTLVTEKENNLKLPNWTEPIYPGIIEELATLEYQISTYTPEMRKLTSGFLFKKIISDSSLKVKRHLTPNTKLFLYSAHEYNLAYFLRFLGAFYSHVPPYGSYILIEIHRINRISYVKVFYQDYKSDKPRRLKIPGCENLCRYDKFVSLYQRYLPNSEQECFENL